MSDHVLAILGVILGVLGIGIGLPGLCQMLWGGPDIEIEFESYMDQESELLITLTNRPIRNRALLKLGLARSVVDITGDYRVVSGKGGELEKNSVTFRLRWDKHLTHIRLASEQSASIVVATKDYMQEHAIVGLGPEDGDSIPMGEGNYVYECNLSIGGRPKNVKRWFRFSNRGLSWLDNEPIT